MNSKAANRSAFLASVFLWILAMWPWVFSSAQGLPFFSDDLLQIPWTKTTGVLTFWSQAGPYGDYRPLHYTLWKCIDRIAGDLSPQTLHLLNYWGGHALCAILVAGLVHQLLSDAFRHADGTRASLAAMFFIIFPFAFDVILWPSAYSYFLATGLTIGALLAYRAARNRPRWHILGLLLTLLAGFSHEGGVVAGAIVFLAALLLEDRASRLDFRTLRWPAAYVAVSLIPLFCISRFAGELPVRFFSGLHPQYSPVILLQGLTYPVAPLAFLLGRALGVDAVLAMTILGLLTLAGLGVWFYRRGQLRVYGFSLGWALLWTAIPFATQAFNWFRDPPRVLYPAAVGAALLWSTALTLLLPENPARRKVQTALWILLSLAATGPAANFLMKETRSYQKAGEGYNYVIEAVAPNPDSEAVFSFLQRFNDIPDRPLLFVNLPERMTFRRRTYPLGHEGVIPLPPPTTLEEMVRVHTGEEIPVLSRQRGDLLPTDMPYIVEPDGDPLTPDDLRRAGGVVITEYEPDGSLGFAFVGAVEAPHDSHPPLARFGDTVELLEGACSGSGPGHPVLELRWRLIAPAGPVTVFAHLRQDGQLIAQADGDPLGRLFPFAQWQPGESALEYRGFEADPTGPVSSVVGIWDPQTGARLPAADAQGRPLPDDALVIPCE